jgi:hypothetical protein
MTDAAYVFDLKQQLAEAQATITALSQEREPDVRIASLLEQLHEGGLAVPAGVTFREHIRRLAALCRDARATIVALVGWQTMAVAYLQRAEKADARVAALSQWQPIETAPKDGTGILAWDMIEHMIMFWHNGAWRDTDLDDMPIQPTHWIRLPSPPVGYDAFAD